MNVTAAVEHWHRLFESRALPVLTASRDDTLRMLDRLNQVTAGEIQHSWLHDPLLCLRVVRMANGGRSRGFFASDVSSIEAAVAVLGVPPLLERVSRIITVEEWPHEAPELRAYLQRQMCRMFHAAYQARDFAILSRDLKSEEVFLAALLHDAVDMLLWLFQPRLAARLTRARRAGAGVDEERRILEGVSLAELRTGLARRWSLPASILAAMDGAQANTPRARFVGWALRIAALTERGWQHEELSVITDELAEALRLSPDRMASIVRYNAVVAARAWWRFGAEPAARWLPMLPGPWWPEELPLDEPATPPVSSPQPVSPAARPARATAGNTSRLHDSASVKGQTPARPAVAAATDADPARDDGHQRRFRAVMNEISHHLDGSLDMHHMMSLIMRGMREGIGLERVVFALYSQDRRQLRAKYVVGAAPDAPLRRFVIGMDGSHLFHRLMARPQALWLRTDNRASMVPLLPDHFREMTEDADFFAMSTFVHDKAIGLFYADACGRELSAFAYEEFRRLCLRAAEGLGHLSRATSAGPRQPEGGR